jgi:SAM-dependent methyltransferase
LQPGVKKILETIQADDSVLDLGCGNGHFLHEIADVVTKLRFSAWTLACLCSEMQNLRWGWSFGKPTLPSCQRSAISYQSLVTGHVITLFATLHHIPSTELRLDILRTVKKLLKPGGRFILSNWQFLNSEKLKARIQPWSRVGLSDQMWTKGIICLDWRSGGEGCGMRINFQRRNCLGWQGRLK